jgi:hypothetical protein
MVRTLLEPLSKRFLIRDGRDRFLVQKTPEGRFFERVLYYFLLPGIRLKPLQPDPV